jgi:hypothetical protein
LAFTIFVVLAVVFFVNKYPLPSNSIASGIAGCFHRARGEDP